MNIVSAHLTGQKDELDGNPLITLAIRAKVPPGTIFKLMSSGRDSMDFSIADRLLCAIGGRRGHPWEGLEDTYFAVDLSGERESKPWHPEYETRVCARDECGESFDVLVNANMTSLLRKKFCSQECSGRVNGVKTKVKPKLHQRPLVGSTMRFAE